jgi:hypothetical protein
LESIFAVNLKTWDIGPRQWDPHSITGHTRAIKSFIKLSPDMSQLCFGRRRTTKCRQRDQNCCVGSALQGRE